LVFLGEWDLFRNLEQTPTTDTSTQELDPSIK